MNTSDETLAWEAGENLSEADKCEYYTNKLTTLLSGRVERAYFFSGPSKNTTKNKSLLLVVQTEVPFTRREMEFADLLKLLPSVGLLIYTPQEFSRLFEAPSPRFWKSVSKNMVQFM